MPLVILWHKLQQIELLLFASVTVNAIIESWLICSLTVSLKVGNFVTSFWHLDCRRIFFIMTPLYMLLSQLNLTGKRGRRCQTPISPRLYNLSDVVVDFMCLTRCDESLKTTQNTHKKLTNYFRCKRPWSTSSGQRLDCSASGSMRLSRTAIIIKTSCDSLHRRRTHLRVSVHFAISCTTESRYTYFNEKWAMDRHMSPNKCLFS